MIRTALLVTLINSAIASAQPPTGSITGTIRYTGVVPPNTRIMTTDGNTIMHNDIVVHPKTKGLRDVIVLLEWKEKTAADAKAAPVLIDQKDMVFLPRVVTVHEGRKVRFENSDNCNHCVDARSVVEGNSFNVATQMGQPYEHRFKAQKNPIPIGCILHNWMRAHVLVVPHPYHAVTAADGRFTVASVPVGKHTLHLIHPDTNHRETIAVEVHKDRAAEVSVEWKKVK